jgi:hypothetical protein
MDTPKLAPGMRRLVALAYSTKRSTPKWKRREEYSLPGPLFDLTVFGIFIVGAALYFL